jgi:hypothetical protein
MDRRYTSNTEYLKQREDDVMQALVTAGAFVALADGRVKRVERVESARYGNRWGIRDVRLTTQFAWPS